jgi:hypothetical protein
VVRQFSQVKQFIAFHGHGLNQMGGAQGHIPQVKQAQRELCRSEIIPTYNSCAY